jgi:putative SOS response-associated peptidase YedK
MFFGALAQVTPGLEPNDQDGYMIVTAARDQGMVDIHDRQPLVLAPSKAREWLAPELDAAKAEEIARTAYSPTEDFEWFRVGRGGKRRKSRPTTDPSAG